MEAAIELDAAAELELTSFLLLFVFLALCGGGGSRACLALLLEVLICLVVRQRLCIFPVEAFVKVRDGLLSLVNRFL